MECDHSYYQTAFLDLTTWISKGTPGFCRNNLCVTNAHQTGPVETKNYDVRHRNPKHAQNKL